MGIGFGGLLDGILLHQVLQWHRVISDLGDPPLDSVGRIEANRFADGAFHVGTWLVLLAGVAIAIVAWQRRSPAPRLREHGGMLLAGWGALNLAEGILDHHVLRIHHVRDDLGGPASWDVGFLLLAAGLVLGGMALSAPGRAARRPRGTSAPSASTTAPAAQRLR